jgi:hypothetical protein
VVAYGAFKLWRWRRRRARNAETEDRVVKPGG